MLFALGYILPSNSVISFLIAIILVEALQYNRIFLASFIAGQLFNRFGPPEIVFAMALVEWMAPPLLTVSVSLLLGVSGYIWNKWTFK